MQYYIVKTCWRHYFENIFNLWPSEMSRNTYIIAHFLILQFTHRYYQERKKHIFVSNILVKKIWYFKKSIIICRSRLNHWLMKLQEYGKTSVAVFNQLSYKICCREMTNLTTHFMSIILKHTFFSKSSNYKNHCTISTNRTTTTYPCINRWYQHHRPYWYNYWCFFYKYIPGVHDNDYFRCLLQD